MAPGVWERHMLEQACQGRYCVKPFESFMNFPNLIADFKPATFTFITLAHSWKCSSGPKRNSQNFLRVFSWYLLLLVTYQYHVWWLCWRQVMRMKYYHKVNLQVMVNHYSLNGQFSFFVMADHFNEKFGNQFWIYLSHLQLCFNLLLDLDSNLFNSLSLPFCLYNIKCLFFGHVCSSRLECLSVADWL